MKLRAAILLATVVACTEHPDPTTDQVERTVSCPAPVLPPATGFPTCDGSYQGLEGPQAVCSPGHPCSITIDPANDACEINSPGACIPGLTWPVECVQPASCACDAAKGEHYVSWPGGELDQGYARWGCEVDPPTSGKHPLVVFFTGSQSGVIAASIAMSFDAKAKTVDISRGNDNAGFVYVSIQPRNLHDFASSNGDGEHEEFIFRDLGSPSCNPDIRAADDLIDMLVAQGKIDRSRIYVSGWSNGATFAGLYAIARHERATPGGNRVAAASVYAGHDPFGGVSPWITATDPTPCQATTYPQSSVPFYEVHSACDTIVPCDSGQAGPKNALTSAEDWLDNKLPNAIGDHRVTDQIIDVLNAPVSHCQAMPPCTEAIGLLDHLQWPNGFAQGNAGDWEPEMLDFLANHPLLL